MTETLPDLLRQWANDRESGVVQKGRSGTLLLRRAARDLEFLARIQEAALSMPTHPTPEQWGEFWRTLDESLSDE